MKRPITISTWDYDRVRAIIDGRVPVEGCDVNYIPLPPEECFHRTYLNREFEVAEIGFSPYLIAVSRGTNDYIALPIFLSRMYRIRRSTSAPTAVSGRPATCAGSASACPSTRCRRRCGRAG